MAWGKRPLQKQLVHVAYYGPIVYTGIRIVDFQSAETGSIPVGATYLLR